MPWALPPTASRLAAHPVPAGVQRSAAAPARSSLIACRAAAAAPPAPDLAAASTERRQATAGGQLPSTSSSVGTYPVPGSWLAYSLQLRNNQPGLTDIVVERLRRQLGWGGRWAWEWDLEEAESDDEQQAELLSEAEEAAAGASSSGHGSSRPQPIVRSSRARGRRSSARRRCRGQALMGAGVYDPRRPWSEGDVLPAELQTCHVDRLLTAEQESWLGELVQAGRAAQLQQQAAPAGGSSSGGSGSSSLWRQRASGPSEPLEHAMQRGVAAQQLLFDANLRLVRLAQRKLLGGGRVLPPQLKQELENAGRDALWRAAAGFQPGRHLRFSSYAVSAIQNAMRTVMRHSGEVGMHVPGNVRPWEARVRSTAHGMQRRRQAFAEQAPAEQLPQLPQQPTSAAEQQQAQAQAQAQQPVSTRRSRQQRQQQQAGVTPLERLAAAARLTPRQVLLGLAAGRRQRLASFGCLVAAEALEGGAGGRRSNRADQLARFGDLPQQEQQEQDEAQLASAAAREAVQLLLSHLPTSRHADVLRLRHRLDDACCSAAACGAAELQELDFTSVGRQLGVSRQRAQVLYRAAVDAARQQAAALGVS